MYGNILIIIALAFGIALGFKKGFFGSLIDFIGSIIIIILAFTLKNPVSVFLYENFPFFDLGGISVLNILLYELIAFLIIYTVLTIIYRIIVNATTIFEKLLNMTVIFGIPSKLLGAVVGLFDSYVFVFIALYILSLPMFSLTIVTDSSLAKGILKNTPILSGLCDKTVDVIYEFKTIRENYDKDGDLDKANLDTLDTFLKYEVITVENADKLIEKDKLQINNVESVLKKYRNKTTQNNE